MRIFYRILIICFLFLSCHGPKHWECDGNCYNGIGVKRWKDGSYVKGHWKNGMLNGYGSSHYGTLSRFVGDTYEGNYKNGEYDGMGRYIEIHDNEVVITGEWHKGKPNGYGEAKWGLHAKCPNRYYQGNWIDGDFSGQGTLYFGTNCDRANEHYTGEFIAGKMNGSGSYYYANGDKFIGHFKDDVMDGEGTYIFQDGATFRGRWINGENDKFRKLLESRRRSRT